MAQGQPAREEFVTADAETGNRLDRVLATRISELSRTRIKALILAGEVSLGGRTIRDPGHRVNAGETVAIAIPAPEPATPEGEAIPLNIVYEDDEIIVLDKPKGLVVHSAAGHASGTLVNALIAPCADRPLRRKPLRHRRGAPARHRAPTRQGYDRPDGGGQDRPGTRGTDAPVR